MTIPEIKAAYGKIIADTCMRWNHRPEVIGGIIMRESSGRPEVIGDSGHGHGLMQIDDRSYPAFCSDTNKWQAPAQNINMGCAILSWKRKQVIQECETFEVTATEEEIERMAIAGFNCGADNAVHCFRHGLDVDARTTGKDYCKSVLQYAAEYFAA